MTQEEYEKARRAAFRWHRVECRKINLAFDDELLTITRTGVGSITRALDVRNEAIDLAHLALDNALTTLRQQYLASMENGEVNNG